MADKHSSSSSSSSSSSACEWTCAACNMLNPPASANCDICDAPRSDDEATTAPPSPSAASRHLVSPPPRSYAAALPPLPPQPPAAGGSEPTSTYVVYLELAEPPQFATFLSKCEGLCDPLVHQHCFQRGGSRHVTLLTVKNVTPSQAAGIRFSREAEEAGLLPFDLEFEGFHPMAGAVALQPAETPSTKALGKQALKRSLINLPLDQRDCAFSGSLHLSLYRVRGFSNKAEALREFDGVRGGLRGVDVGGVRAVAIKIKVLGGDYEGEGRVLMEGKAQDCGGSSGEKQAKRRKK